jgi:O-antigen/teichoic acid export membrane protein
MFAVLDTMTTLVQTVFPVFIAVRGYGLEWLVLSQIGAEILFTVIVFRINAREIGFPRFTLKGLKVYLKFSIPQIPNPILLWVMSSSSRYFITHLLGISQAGIYSASNGLGNLISFFCAPISFILFPVIARFWDQGDQARVRRFLEYSTKLFLLLSIPATAGIYILSQPLLRSLTTAEYLAGRNLVLLVALGVVFLGIYQINVYIILLSGRTKWWLTLILAIGAGSSALINAALIPRIGIMGAAISIIVSYFILCVIVTVWAKKMVGFKIDIMFIFKLVVASAIMGFCVNLIPVSGTLLSLVLPTIAGVAIFGIVILVTKAFNKEDIGVLRAAVSGLNPKLWRV